MTVGIGRPAGFGHTQHLERQPAQLSVRADDEMRHVREVRRERRIHQPAHPLQRRRQIRRAKLPRAHAPAHEFHRVINRLRLAQVHNPAGDTALPSCQSPRR